MIDILNVQAVILDHSYCKPAPLDTEFSPIWDVELQKMADNIFDWKDEIGVEFDPPMIDADVPFSSLSPSHSVDSGFDNEMNFLNGLDLDSILCGDVSASASNLKQQSLKPKTSTRASTSTTVTEMNSKDTELSEAEKSKKNAIAARENRVKKKKYLEGIEKELKDLRKDNETLKAKERLHDQVVGKLQNEVSYLKNVLANQSTLSTLMNRLVSTPGLSFNLATEEPSTETHDDENRVDDSDDHYEPEQPTGNVLRGSQTRYQTRGTKRKVPTEQETTGQKKSRNGVKGGICLHVGQDMVSLKFCSQCSRSGDSGN